LHKPLCKGLSRYARPRKLIHQQEICLKVNDPFGDTQRISPEVTLFHLSPPPSEYARADTSIQHEADLYNLLCKPGVMSSRPFDPYLPSNYSLIVTSFTSFSLRQPFSSVRELLTVSQRTMSFIHLIYRSTHESSPSSVPALAVAPLSSCLPLPSS